MNASLHQARIRNNEIKSSVVGPEDMLFQPQSGNLPYACFGLRRMAVQPRERQRSAGASFETSIYREDSATSDVVQCQSLPLKGSFHYCAWLLLWILFHQQRVIRWPLSSFFRSNRITWHELAGVHWWHHISDDCKHFHFYPLSVPSLNSFRKLECPALTGEEKGKNGFSKGKGDLDLQGNLCGQNRWLIKYLLVLLYFLRTNLVVKRIQLLSNAF